MLFVRSGKRLVMLRRVAARVSGSRDFLVVKSGKLLEGPWLEDLEEPEDFSVLEKIMSGIWTPQLHFLMDGKSS